MNRILIVLLSVGLLLACSLGTTFSLPLQSPALILIGVAGLLGMTLVSRASLSMRILLPVILAISYFLWRAVISPVPDLASEDIFLILAAGILYIVSGYIVAGPGIRLSLAAVILFMLCLHIGSALLQLTGNNGYSFVGIFSAGVSLPWAPPEGWVTPVSGMYGYQGSFANFAVISGLLALSLGLWGRFHTWLRVALCLLAIVALMCASFAQSRSAILGLIAGCGVLSLLLWISFNGQGEVLRNRLRKFILLGGCAGMLIGGGVGIWVFVNRAPTEEKEKLTFSTNARLGYWPMAVEQFIDHPIIGAGSRSFSYECFQYWNPTLASYEADPEFAHNEYLQVMADYGLIGLLLVIFLLGMHLVIGVRQIVSLSTRVKEDGFLRGSNAMALAIAGVVGIVVMSVHIVFDFKTHLFANLLLLVCCIVWVLPVVTLSQIKKHGVRNCFWSYLLAFMLLVIGAVSVGLGCYHLKGGGPLLRNRMATESGLWTPQAVQSSVWIPALEKSVKSAPTYRRLLKLGALYRLEAEQLRGAEREFMLRKAIAEYNHAAERHPYEPVSQINLAELHGYLGEYEKADQFFLQADRLGSVRNFWLKIDLKWAEMLRLRAGALWREGNVKDARTQYQRAYELLEPLEVFREEIGQAYLKVMIEYVALLDGMSDYETADALIENAMLKLPNGITYNKKHNFFREIGEHYLRKAKFLWYKRKPDKAYQALVLAEKNYTIHKTLLQGEVDDRGAKGYEEVKQIMEFFRKTGIGKNE